MSASNLNILDCISLLIIVLGMPPGWSLDLWGNAECGCSVCSHSWPICPPNHRGCHMERVFGRVCGVGYPYLVCRTNCDGWLSQQIWADLLVQWDCCEGTMTFPLKTFSSHQNSEVRMAYKSLQCLPTEIDIEHGGYSPLQYGMVLNFDATKHCICWRYLPCLLVLPCWTLYSVLFWYKIALTMCRVWPWSWN